MDKRRPAVMFRPGTMLLEELDARGWTVDDLANRLSVPRETVCEVIIGSQGISDELADGLSRALGTSAALWRNMERRYRQWVSEERNGQ